MLSLTPSEQVTYIIWAVYPDESINDEDIKVTILATGKELENG